MKSNLTPYKLLDSGIGRKLEIIGPYKVIRPSPQAIWKPLYPKLWEKIDSECLRNKDGSGSWKHQKKVDPFFIELDPPGLPKIQFELKFTGFGHCGLFFEQTTIWQIIFQKISELKTILKRPPMVLNLFGYTGAASLYMAKAGAQVFHVDSSKGVLSWGEDIANKNKINSIQWVHSDVLTYLNLMKKKKLKFDAILMDPPTWGHGAKKEKWNFDTDLNKLLDTSFELLAPQSFILLSSHTPGVQAQALENCLSQFPKGLHLSSSDLGCQHEQDQRVLPAGIFSLASSF